MRQPKRKLWPTLAALTAWLLIWQLAYWLIGQDFLLASPGQVLRRVAVLCSRLDFWLAVLGSMLRIQVGFLAGVAVGTLMAVATSLSPWLRAFLQPAISAIRATPVASFIILAFFWMSSSRVVVFIVFLMVLPIVWANVSEGISKTNPQLLEMARIFRMSRNQILRLVYVPSVSPFFITAASTSLGLGWKAGIAAEVISNPGFALGGRLYEAKIYLETADLLAYTLVIILLSLLLEKAMLRIFKRSEIYFGQHGRMLSLFARPAAVAETERPGQAEEQSGRGYGKP